MGVQTAGSCPLDQGRPELRKTLRRPVLGSQRRQQGDRTSGRSLRQPEPKLDSLAAAERQGHFRKWRVHGRAVRSAIEYGGRQRPPGRVPAGSGRTAVARVVFSRLFILRREALAQMHESLEQVQSKIAYLERAMAELS